jgi:hypothetical protein
MFGGALVAGEIRAVPGSSSRFVVSRRATEVDPSFAGLVLYDSSTELGTWSGFVGGESIAFTSATTLYGYNNEDTGFDLFEFAVSSSGFQQVADTMGLVSGFNVEITSGGGWVFATDGQAIDGATGQLAGAYAATGLVWPDSNGADVWFLDGSLLDFDRATFLLKRSYPLPAGASASSATVLVGWSSTAFAYVNPTSVCIVNL